MAQPAYERRLALVMFGNGGQARLVDEKAPIRNSRNVIVTPILIIPTKELKQKHDITDDELNIETPEGYRAKWVEYPKQSVYYIDTSPRDAVLIVEYDFRGNETIMSRRRNGLLEWDQIRDKMEEGLMNANAFLTEQFKTSQSQLLEVARSTKEVQDALEISATPEDEKEEEEEK